MLPPQFGFGCLEPAPETHSSVQIHRIDSNFVTPDPASISRSFLLVANTDAQEAPDADSTESGDVDCHRATDYARILSEQA